MSKGITFEKKDGKNVKIGIVVARWNNEITDALLADCKKALQDCGVPEDKIIVQFVPGSFELIYGAHGMLEEHSPDAVVVIGALIKGETAHFEYLASAVSTGIVELNLKYNTPVIFGVLTCLNEEQARARSMGEKGHGYGWGMSAVEMATMKKRIY